MTPYYQRLREANTAGYMQKKPVAAKETFTCPDCGREFGTEAGLKIHQTKTHEA